MSSESKTCSICGRPQGKSGTGSFTQWLSQCRCDKLEKPVQQSQVCATCGLPIGGVDTGSFTQWVFKPKSCQCRQSQSTTENQLSARFENAGSSKTGKNSPNTLSIENSVDHTLPSRRSATSGALNHAELPTDAEKFPLDRYRPIRALGAGGVGTVQLCFDKKLNKEVAVKVLKVATPDQLLAFQLEAKVTAKLSHPDIVSILDFGITEHGAPYMVLEHVEGVGLNKVLKQHGRLDQTTTLAIAIKIVGALEHAHSTGIFHRDVSASNILVLEKAPGQWDVHIIDFGIAFLESSQKSLVDQGKTLVGTPRYMSPDQFLGRRFDARSEVYSVGCLLYEMLTGVVPFVTDDPLALLEMHASSPLVPISEASPNAKVSVALEQIILTCLEKEPDRRFQNMHELASALQDCFAESVALFETATYMLPKPQDAPDSAKKLMIAGVAACLLAIGGIAVAIWMLDKREISAPIRTEVALGVHDVNDSMDAVADQIEAKTTGMDLVGSDLPVGPVISKSPAGTATAALTAMSNADLPDIITDASQQYIVTVQEKPVIKEVLKDPDFKRAFTADRLSRFYQSEAGTVWSSESNFIKILPRLTRLWGDTKLLDVFKDPLVHKFLCNPKQWLPENGAQFHCPPEYSSNEHIQRLVNEARFQSLLEEQAFHKVILDHRLQDLIRDRDNWRLTLIYFINLNHFDRIGIRRSTNGWWFLVTPTMKDVERLTKEENVRSVEFAQFDVKLFDDLPSFPAANLILRQISPWSLKRLDWSKLKRLPNLNYLDVTSSDDITAAQLDSIASLGGLKRLGLASGKTISKEGLSKLNKLRHLKSLILEYNRSIDDKALEHIVKLPLDELWLSHTNVSAAGLRSIARIKSLKHVDLSDTRLEKFDGLHVLGDLKQLRSLTIGSVTRPGFDWRLDANCVRLKSRLPDLRITLNDTGSIVGTTVSGKISVYDLSKVKRNHE
jgi:serine/threonine protein kinase